MRLKENCNFPAFLQAVDRCTGKVSFETPEGDVLNLKSQLSKFIFLAAVSSPNIHALSKGEILCTDVTDYTLLADHLR